MNPHNLIEANEAYGRRLDHFAWMLGAVLFFGGISMAVWCAPLPPTAPVPAADAGGEQGVLEQLEALVLSDLTANKTQAQTIADISSLLGALGFLDAGGVDAAQILQDVLTTLMDTGQLPQKHPSLLPAARAMRGAH